MRFSSSSSVSLLISSARTSASPIQSISYRRLKSVASSILLFSLDIFRSPLVCYARRMVAYLGKAHCVATDRSTPSLIWPPPLSRPWPGLCSFVVSILSRLRYTLNRQHQQKYTASFVHFHGSVLLPYNDIIHLGGDTMTVSKAHIRATTKWEAKAYDKIMIRIPKGERDRYKQAAEERGLSLNQLFIQATEEYLKNY